MGIIAALLIAVSPFEVSALRDHPTFYCGCDQGTASTAFKACGYVPKRKSIRSRRVEWEHVMPASFFGRTFRAWTQGNEKCVSRSGKKYRGRRCARKVSPVFRHMELDPHNLVPSVGELNGARSNKPFGEVPGEPREFGVCDFEVNKDVVEPAPHLRGDIARIYLYMFARYPKHVPLTKVMIKELEVWAAGDPVDSVECHRQRAVASTYRHNHYVEQACRLIDSWK